MILLAFSWQQAANFGARLVGSIDPQVTFQPYPKGPAYQPAQRHHPGEPVFETVTDLFLGQCDHQGMRGAVFFDSQTDRPYIFYLAKIVILSDPGPDPTGEFSAAPEIVEECVTGIRRYDDGQCELAPAHLLLTLSDLRFTADDLRLELKNRKSETQNLKSADTLPVEAFLIEVWGQRKLDELRREAEDRLRSS